MFENLQEITIWKSSLTIIERHSLMHFDKLTYLNLSNNSIEEIPAGLFDFNHDLKTIILSNNPIFYINSKVFDHLTKLTTLRLANNYCIDESTEDNKKEVSSIIKSVKTQCLHKELEDMNKEVYRSINNLERISKMILVIKKHNKNENLRNLVLKNLTERINLHLHLLLEVKSHEES